MNDAAGTASSHDHRARLADEQAALRRIATRVALGGLLRIDSPAGDGTVLTARLPLSTR
jgi:hypothetical protein